MENQRVRRSANSTKYLARNAVRVAIILGRMPSASEHFCFTCGASADQGARMGYHHVDYDKPLEVIPVCHKCHMKVHAWEKANAYAATV
jgi:hypothetical protein